MPLRCWTWIFPPFCCGGAKWQDKPEKPRNSFTVILSLLLLPYSLTKSLTLFANLLSLINAFNLLVCGGLGWAFCWLNLVLKSGWGMTWNGPNVILVFCTIAIVGQGITVQWKGLMRQELWLNKLNWDRITVSRRTPGWGLSQMFLRGWWWWMKVSWKNWSGTASLQLKLGI